MSNDLQVLYKMRDIFKREEYVKNYNAEIHGNLKKAVTASITGELRKKNDAYNAYKNKLNEKAREKQLKSNIVIPCIILLVGFIILIAITTAISKDSMYGLMYLFVSCVWLVPIIIFASAEATSGKKEINDHYITLKAAVLVTLWIACVILAICFAAASGACNSFWTWVLGVIVAVFWIIGNFFFLGKTSGFMLLVLLGFTILLGFVVVTMFDLSSSSGKAEQDSEVLAAKRNYDKACAEYDDAYNRRYANMKGTYLNLLKPDTSAQEKRALVSVIPQQFHEIDMINKLIWCIEQRYAYDIVGARNWYLQQEHNAAMMKKLDGIAYEVRRSNEIAAQAAKDAQLAHAEAMQAINKLNKNVAKGNEIAAKNAEANKKSAYYTEKLHDAVKGEIIKR